MTDIATSKHKPMALWKHFDFTPYQKMAIILIMGFVILGIFWFTSRYPQLFDKSAALATYQPQSYIYTSVLIQPSADAGFLAKVMVSSVNWIYSMRFGMTFGLLMGALMHTLFAFYPLKLTANVMKNTLKGVMAGAPAGVCVNCAVPIACGLTRGKSNVETALGFMFSSPTLNFVVVSMVFTALPLQYGIIYYSFIALVLLGFVPMIARFSKKQLPKKELPDNGTSHKFPTSEPVLGTPNGEAHLTASKLEAVVAIPSSTASEVCSITALPPAEPWRESLQQVAIAYSKHLWSLIQSAVPMMLLASVLSAVVMELIPFQLLLKQASLLGILATAMVTVLLPVPIAMEVMVAHHLYVSQVPAPFVILFLMTLGSYSILPMIYLSQEVSKRLAFLLYGLFVLLGSLSAWLITL
ncbi:MAG: permease [Cyanobacteria bacterium P01_H01_bin.74]